MIIRPAVFDRYILVLDIAGFGQALTKGGSHRRVRPGRRAVEKPDHWHSRLLRARRERPAGHSAKQRDELASPHVPSNPAAKPTISSGSRNRVVQHSKIGWSGSGSGHFRHSLY